MSSTWAWASSRRSNGSFVGGSISSAQTAWRGLMVNNFIPRPKHAIGRSSSAKSKSRRPERTLIAISHRLAILISTRSPEHARISHHDNVVMQNSRESNDLRLLYRACLQIYCIYSFVIAIISRRLSARILSCGCRDLPDKLRSWLTTEIDSPAKIALTIICSLRLISEGDRSRYSNSCDSSTRSLSLCGGWIEMG